MCIGSNQLIERSLSGQQSEWAPETRQRFGRLSLALHQEIRELHWGQELRYYSRTKSLQPHGSLKPLYQMKASMQV